MFGERIGKSPVAKSRFARKYRCMVFVDGCVHRYDEVHSRRPLAGEFQPAFRAKDAVIRNARPQLRACMRMNSRGRFRSRAKCVKPVPRQFAQQSLRDNAACRIVPAKKQHFIFSGHAHPVPMFFLLLGAILPTQSCAPVTLRFLNSRRHGNFHQVPGDSTHGHNSLPTLYLSQTSHCNDAQVYQRDTTPYIFLSTASASRGTYIERA